MTESYLPDGAPIAVPEGTAVSFVVEKTRAGEDAPYQTVVGHPDGTETVIDHERREG